MKKILVPQRENAIVNRLNKTKVEKFPDLGVEKEEKLKALRKKDQAAKLERVSGCLRAIHQILISFTEKGRSKSGSRAEGEEVAEGTCL